jgi:hypothetical protein
MANQEDAESLHMAQDDLRHAAWKPAACLCSVHSTSVPRAPGLLNGGGHWGDKSPLAPHHRGCPASTTRAHYSLPTIASPPSLGGAQFRFPATFGSSSSSLSIRCQHTHTHQHTARSFQGPSTPRNPPYSRRSASSISRRAPRSRRPRRFRLHDTTSRILRTC